MFKRIIQKIFIIGCKNVGAGTRRRLLIDGNKEVHFSVLSQVEPNCFNEAKTDEHWINTMEEEMNQIEKNHDLGTCSKY